MGDIRIIPTSRPLDVVRYRISNLSRVKATHRAALCQIWTPNSQIHFVVSDSTFSWWWEYVLKPTDPDWARKTSAATVLRRFLHIRNRSCICIGWSESALCVLMRNRIVSKWYIHAKFRQVWQDSSCRWHHFNSHVTKLPGFNMNTCFK